MCLMAPAQVVRVEGSFCDIELGGRVSRATMLLEPDLQPGDWVLIASGTVVRRLDPEQAADMRRAVELLSDPTDVGAGVT